GDRLYFTLGASAPVSIIDAADGKVLAVCKGSESASKLLLSDGVLVAQMSKALVAFDGVTGKQLWKVDNRAGSPAASGSKLIYTNGGNSMRCVDIRSGKTIWDANPRVTGNTMISGDTILSIAGSSMQTLSLTSGKTIWDNKKSKPKGRRRGHSGVYIVDDTIWLGYRGERVDLKTGKKLKSLGVKGLWSPQHHHRCYTNKATSRYVIGAMEGMEYLAIKGDEHSRNNWVRGSCRLGIMPANGMTYVPTDQCYCSAGVKLLGFNALIGAKDPGPADPIEKRLEKGPAYGKIGKAAASGPKDWPAFRHDSLRSGAIDAQLPAEIKSAWNAQLPGTLTQPVAVGDTVWVASRDTHTLYALNAETGEKRWSFIAGGRIDSPPTIHNGTVLLGSADGYVYCLRATDGQLAWRFRAAPHELAPGRRVPGDRRVVQQRPAVRLLRPREARLQRLHALLRRARVEPGQERGPHRLEAPHRHDLALLGEARDLRVEQPQQHRQDLDLIARDRFPADAVLARAAREGAAAAREEPRVGRVHE
ncbi:MAG: PQQ-binding-like beta-propeller repeat protein, partial [Phycisphaerae bacterium]|nr:PQQ-binding-like beta-propeller repeat protein [Phycisphaerae bacterium]